MKEAFIYTGVVLLSLTLLYSACSKEYSKESSTNTSQPPSNPDNKPPIARARPDTTITLPADTVILDGSGSTDPENDITGYAWTKISGPSSFAIGSPGNVRTLVTNLVQGIYQFELKVTDKGGLFSKDTIQVTVRAALPSPVPSCNPGNRPLINAQLVPVTDILPGSTAYFCSSGNKLFFLAWDSATNPDDTLPAKAHLNIFDVVAQTWSSSNSGLVANRSEMAIVAAGGKIFVAGGYFVDSLGAHYTLPDVNIYDISSDSWTTTYLSLARRLLTTAVAGNKVFFAGGLYHPANAVYDDAFASSTVVDIYDLSANSWSSAALSQPRTDLTAVAAAGNVYFAGGMNSSSPTGSSPTNVFSDRIDIYNGTAGTWSTSSLTEPKIGVSGISDGTRIFWSGGINLSGLTASVETRDINTGVIALSCLFQPNADFGSVEENNKLIFFTGDGAIKSRFDIYDIAGNTWSVGALNQSIIGTVLLANNTAYVVGRELNVYAGKIWKLVF